MGNDKMIVPLLNINKSLRKQCIRKMKYKNEYLV